MYSMSMTGVAKPLCTSISPISCISVKRLMCVYSSVLPESLAQLFQGIGTERAEHEQTVDLEHAMNFGNGLLEVIAPLQSQIRPDQTGAGILERHLLDVTAHIESLIPAGSSTASTRKREGGPANASTLQYRLPASCGRIAHKQLARTVPRTAASVENDIRRILYIIEA